MNEKDNEEMLNNTDHKAESDDKNTSGKYRLAPIKLSRKKDNNSKDVLPSDGFCSWMCMSADTHSSDIHIYKAVKGRYEVDIPIKLALLLLEKQKNRLPHRPR